MTYINFNGKLFHSDKPVLKTNNRAFCYGDGLFETMRFHENKILLINDHMDRLFRGMKCLKMEIPKKISAFYIQKQVAQIVRKNGIEGDARIRLQVFRNEGGYYSPTDNTTGFVISAEKLNSDNHTKQKRGLIVDLFSEITKPKSPLSNFKTSNSIIYVLAAIFAKEKKIDDCIILNTEGNVTDSISSNVFIIKKDTLITPPLSDGCMDGVMRKNILKACKGKKIKTSEKSIRIEDLLNADEVFLSNAIDGIRCVKQFRKKIYVNDFFQNIGFQK